MPDETAPLVLIIDDERAICQSLGLHLKFRGMRVDSANSARDGLARLGQGGVDVVLCDIGLPDLSGHEVVQQATQAAVARGELPPEFVVMTANATLDHAVTSLREGACQFVTKPLSMPYLETVVARALEVRDLRRRVRALEEHQAASVMESVEAITSRLSLSDTLAAVLQAAVVLHSAPRAAIWLLDPRLQQLRPMAARAADEGEAPSEVQRSCAEQAVSANAVAYVAERDSFWTAAPIVVDGEVEGALVIERAGSVEMLGGPEEDQALIALAGHAANAIQKDRLFSQLEQSAMQISSLFDVGLAMTSEVSLQRLFEVIVESAARISGAERCSLMLVEPDGETMKIRAARGIDPEVVARAEARVGQGIAGSVASSGEPLHIVDIESDARFGRRNSEQYRDSSLVCVPILVGDRVVGVLNVNNKRNGESFTVNDLNLMTLLASQAAVAIDNAHRYQDLSEQAITDGLTGVYIRRYFDECLDRAVRAALTGGRTFSVLLCDIDHFKQVNDHFGHLAGDAALRHVARCLTQAVRDQDLVARYGGEEFGVLLGRASAATAVAVAERIRALVEQRPARWNEADVPLTISIGVAAFEEAHGSADAVLDAADRALYRAKGEGRNRVVLADPPHA